MNHSAKICAVITEATIASAIGAMNRANREADMIELRLDYLSDFDFTRVDELRALFTDIKLPTIITCRASAEGGQQPIADEIRLPLLVEGAKRYADYCDIEAAHYEQAAKLSPDISKLIVSFHNFDETPAKLNAIYETITRLPAAVHKIATRARTVCDTLAIFQLLERAQRDQRNFIAIAMNEAGVITRLLGCSRGSFLTYGALAAERTSAPGQIACHDLRHVYRLYNLTCETSITGIIGHPVHHSASPALHNRAFAEFGLDFVYLPIEVADVPEFFKRFVHFNSREMDWNLRGLSVTIPHKLAVIPYLDELDITAAKIGAVNTVVVKDQRLIGYNTDVDGAMLPLEKVCALADQDCAVIGAGGAARAVIYGLLERGARVTVFARDLTRAQSLAEQFAIRLLPMEALGQSSAQILINTTPIGMRSHSENETLVPESAIKACEVVYDLVYTPLETRLLKDARNAGRQTISGLDMLVAQAALQFELWTGRKPDLEIMRNAAREAIRV